MKAICYVMGIILILPLSYSTVSSAASTATFPEAGNALLMRAVRAIRAQEQAIRNIRIHASYRFWGVFHDPVDKKIIWANRNDPINRYVLVATMDGLPYGMFRADVQIEQILVRPDIVPDVDSFIAAYNGRVGTYLKTAGGTPGKLHPYNDGRVSGIPPNVRTIIDQAIGWGCSIYGFTGDFPFDFHPRFSEYISHGPKPGQKHVSLSTRWTQRHGKKYLEITRIGSPDGKNIFLLNPRKGFSIAECKHYGWDAKVNASGRIHLVSGKRLKYSFQVHQFLEPSPGVYYPQKIKMENFDYIPSHEINGHDHEISAMTVKVSKVVINDPTITGNTYVVEFPRDAVVRDLATGRLIHVGGTPHQQWEEIERAIEKARKYVTKTSETRP